MATKIQINSHDALERLIGDDPDVEVEVRGSVVKEFAKRLRPMMGSLIEAEMKNVLLKNDPRGFGRTMKLTNTAKQLIASAVKDLAREMIREEVDKALQKEGLKKMVRECVDAITADAIRKEVKQRIARLMAEALD